MRIVVDIPSSHGYAGTREWFVDPAEGWTIADLCSDIAHAVRAEGVELHRDGAALPTDALVVDALVDGATVSLVGG